MGLKVGKRTRLLRLVIPARRDGGILGVRIDSRRCDGCISSSLRHPPPPPGEGWHTRWQGILAELYCFKSEDWLGGGWWLVVVVVEVKKKVPAKWVCGKLLCNSARSADKLLRCLPSNA